MEAVLDERPWRRVTWRQGTKGRLSARFSALLVRVADGPVFGNNRHLPGEEVWLVGEWRSSGERKYYLSNLPARITRRALVGAIKRAGCASRRTSNSRRNSASTTSRAAPGPGCTATR